ncbi:MAG: fibronectin type III domain-containing protein, partial [Actinomycetota bacterium]|nr:fibronectin type III domain-containing protein [Actinomycetota bacterium]
MFGEVRTNERLWRVVLIITMVAGLLPIMPTASQAAVGDTPPTWPSDASIAVSAVTTGSATLDWPAALDDAGVVGYRLYDGADALIDSTASTSYNLSGLIADTSYTVRVEAYDAGGNESTQLSGLNYGPRLALYAGNEPHSIDIADLNHDGDLDLAIAVRGDDSASILLGNGDGTFGSRSIYSVGTSGDGVGPKNLAFGYFNADGDLDIVSANQDDGTSGVILGNGDGSFGSVTPYVTSYGTHDVAVGDFNNDGDDDFMVVGWGTNDGTVWLGNGDGTFSTPVDYPAGSLSHGIVTADFDNDGDLDVATAANSDSAAASLRGNGDGSFQAPLIYEGTPNGWAHDIAMGDFDEDGDEDIVIAGENADNLSVFFGASGTTFSTNTTYSVADEPKGVSVGDLNDDGHDDLIATSVIQHYPTCPGGNNDPLTFWFGDGNGNFSSGGSVNVGEAPFDAAVADFNGDGWSDLAAPSWCDDTVSIFLNLGEGGPTTTFQTLAGGDPTEPGTPGAPSATAGDQVATVTWSAPSNGGSPILSYDLQLENLTTANSTTTGVGLTLSEDLTGLSNGDSYRARVRAANIVGNGAWSNWSANFIPSAGATVPGAPGTPAVSGGDAQLTAVWTVPGSDGGSAITSYDLQIHDQTADTYNTTDVGLTLTEDMTGLTNGNSHRTRVRATNSVGTGPWSGWSSSVIPQTTPDAPTTPGATAGDGQLTTTWSPPFDGGSTITSYDLRVRNLTEGTNTTTNVGLSLAETVTGLTNGNNYDVGVRAINSNGAGGWSPWSDTVVPQTVPDAPDTPLLAAGEGEVTVDWSQPFNGGAAITSYEVELEDESDGSSIFFDPGLDLTETVTGLVNGHSYRAAVRAENVNGWSDWSAWSDSAVPGSTPGAPGTPVLVGGAGEADAVWIAPGDDGGSAISGYEIQVENQTMAVSSYVELGLVLETTLTGLSNGETYRVRAINADGRGAWSDWSPSVVPSTVPTAPAAPGLAA